LLLPSAIARIREGNLHSVILHAFFLAVTVQVNMAPFQVRVPVQAAPVWGLWSAASWPFV
jgi:hypothetical protein